MTCHFPGRLAPILMKPDEVLPLKRAAHHAGRSPDTIKRWCKDYGICRQAGPNAPIEVSVIGLEMVLHDDREALELFREGERSHPAVRRYLDHLGLPG